MPASTAPAAKMPVYIMPMAVSSLMRETRATKPTVATVSKKGKIKAKKKGTTTITVKAANGKSAKFKVKVT